MGRRQVQRHGFMYKTVIGVYRVYSMKRLMQWLSGELGSYSIVKINIKL